MQKLDFVTHLKTIIEKLKSQEIVAIFNEGFRNPGNVYGYNSINPLLFTSKSNLDQIKLNEDYLKILDELKINDIYNEKNLSHLTTLLRSESGRNLLSQPAIVSFYNMHNTLLNTYKLSHNVLIGEIIAESYEIENGIIIFQIIVEGDGLETEQYVKILGTLNELATTIGKIFGETDKSEIVLLDSGSDTNLGLKTGIETAKSLFLIFKEVWDFITNFRFYKQKQKTNALLESLTIRTIINEKFEEGIITKEEAQEYIHLIKTRTDDLIGLKVMPKQIVIENNTLENKKLLKEFEGLKLITKGDK